MKDIKILLVDDDIDFVFIQKAFLEKEGFQVITAGDLRQFISLKAFK